MHSIVVQSPYLKDFLKQVLAGYPGVTVGLDRLEFAGRFEPLIYRWKELNAVLGELKADADAEGPVIEVAPVAQDAPAINADPVAVGSAERKEHVNGQSNGEETGNEKVPEVVERYVTLAPTHIVLIVVLVLARIVALVVAVFLARNLTLVVARMLRSSSPSQTASSSNFYSKILSR